MVVFLERRRPSHCSVAFTCVEAQDSDAVADHGRPV
jgi:hypothetical protein